MCVHVCMFVKEEDSPYFFKSPFAWLNTGIIQVSISKLYNFHFDAKC